MDIRMDLPAESLPLQSQAQGKIRRIFCFGVVNFNSIYRVRTSSSKGLQCGCRLVKFLLSFGIGDATILDNFFIIATLVVLLNQLTNLTNRLRW
jgi:hypothetical protein